MNIKNIAYKGSLIALTAGVLATGVAFADNNNKHSDEARKVGSGLEVQINQNGRVLVRGAKVTAVSGNKITATTAWGSANVTWTVNVSSSTEYVHKHGGKSSVSDIAVGNVISFNGEINPNAGAFSVDAKVVKNWSIEKQRVTLQGEVKTDPGNTTPTSFVLSARNRDYTVNIPSGISVLNSKWQIIQTSAIEIGHKIRAYGSLNTSTSVLDATVIRDISIK